MMIFRVAVVSLIEACCQFYFTIGLVHVIAALHLAAFPLAFDNVVVDAAILLVLVRAIHFAHFVLCQFRAWGKHE